MASQEQESGVRIELLGRFRVLVGGDDVGADAWPGRRAAELVQLLALAEVKGHRAHAGRDTAAAGDHFRTAATRFGASGQPLDEARCAALAASLTGERAR